MIEDFIIERVQKLLALGKMTQKEIAIEVGISRGIVRNVAIGRRRPCDVQDNGSSGTNEKQRIVPSYKCSGCDNSVTTIPCRICQARSYQRRRGIIRDIKF